jgi:hypothetical protein
MVKLKSKSLFVGLILTLTMIISLFAGVIIFSPKQTLEVSAAEPGSSATLKGFDSFTITGDGNNTWEGEHSMVEFLVTTRGDTYYGCYYSPDDVPLAFQNTAAELTQCGHDSWKWSAEGDNSGKTMKIMDHWYYFEASF